MPLIVDPLGNYYAVVPKGGGVLLSVVLSYNNPYNVNHEEETDSSDSSSSSTEVEPVTPVVETLSDAAVVSMINNTPYGGTVTISEISGTGLSNTIVSSLLERRDVTVMLTFTFNGISYKIVIPAGADLLALLNAYGGIDFTSLCAAFGVTPE